MTDRSGHPGRRWRLAAAPLAGVALMFVAWGFTRVNGPPSVLHRVEVRGMEFHPARLEVAPGDTVVWVNADIVPHTATAAGSAGLDTGPLGPGESGRYVAGVSGEVRYVCSFHPSMRGSLVIR